MNKQEEKSRRRKMEEGSLIKFLEKNKQGGYAEIERSSLDYLRIKEETIVVEEEDNYYYGISC